MDDDAELKTSAVKFKNPLEITLSLSVVGPRESDPTMLYDYCLGLP